MLRSVEAEDHMTRSPVTLRPETHIFEAIRALTERSISGATVLDDEGRVVGVISEMDCLQAVLSDTYHGEAGGTVADIMTTEVESVEIGASVVDVAQKLIDGHRRRFFGQGGQVRRAGLLPLDPAGSDGVRQNGGAGG